MHSGMWNITLDNFEEELPGKIVTRGYEYYEDGAVLNLCSKEGGAYKAQVSGDRQYAAEVALSGRQVTFVRCDCPYVEGVRGAWCKHLTAVLYALRYGVEDSEKEEESCRSSTPLKSTEDIIENLDYSELKQIVYRLMDEYPEIEDFIAIHYTPKRKFMDKTSIKHIIRQSIKSVERPRDVVHTFEAYRAMAGANEILNEAEARESSSLEEALTMYLAVLEECVPALQKVDDSNADVGDCIRHAHGRMQEIVPFLSEPEARKCWYTALIKETFKKKYEGWDDPWEFLITAGLLVDDHKRRDHFFKKVDAYIEYNKAHLKEYGFEDADSFIFRYDQGRAAETKMEVIERLDGEEAAEMFARDHLSLDNMREHVVQKAFDSGAYEEARQVSIEGVGQFEQEKLPGLVYKFRNWLFAIAEATENTEEIISYGSTLFLDRGNFDYYERLKSALPRSRWKEVKKMLEKHITDGLAASITLAELYFREGELEQLINVLEKHPALLDQYDRPPLTHSYPGRLAKLYEVRAREEIVNTGRGVYAVVRNYLERMKQLGATERASELAQQFREEYSNRPAMLEELAGL